MKKILMTVAVVLAFGLASCNKDTNRCWEITITTEVLGAQITTTNYAWCSENELEAEIKMLEEEFNVNRDAIKYKRTNKAEADCYKDE